MPEVGEIRRGRDIGKPKSGNHAYVWHACVDCGKERWIHIIREQPNRKRCRSCVGKGRIIPIAIRLKMSLAGRRNPNSRFIDKNGYAWVRCYRESEFYPMCIRTRISEHRLVMAKHLRRCLTRQEHVHHINGDRADNRLENLELISQANHNVTIAFCNNCKVKKENRHLRLQNEQLLKQIRELNLRFIGAKSSVI